LKNDSWFPRGAGLQLMHFNNPPGKIKNNMTTPPLKKSIGRSPLRLGFFLAAVAVACFALMPFAQSAQAVGPEPDEGDLVGNMAEEDDAVADLGGDTENVEEGNAVLDFSTGMGNAAMIGKQVKGKPNQWVIKIDFEKFIMCAMEKVRFRGELHFKFQPGDGGNVGFTDIRLKGQVPGKPFNATGTGPKPLGRTYVLQDVKGKGFHIISVRNGHGSVGRKFEFIAKPNPPLQGNASPGKEVKFTLVWAPPHGEDLKIDGELSWEFKNGKVIHLEAAPPEIKCPLH
jgi:hypothetical protein